MQLPVGCVVAAALLLLGPRGAVAAAAAAGGPRGKPGPGTTLNPPELEPINELILTGTCSHEPEDLLEGITFRYMGRTKSGAPWYQSLEFDQYLYFDPDCSGGGDGEGWIIDNNAPDVNADRDLDGDGDCQYRARTRWGGSRGPPLRSMWFMLCEDVWRYQPLTLTENPERHEDPPTPGPEGCCPPQDGSKGGGKGRKGRSTTTEEPDPEPEEPTPAPKPTRAPRTTPAPAPPPPPPPPPPKTKKATTTEEPEPPAPSPGKKGKKTTTPEPEPEEEEPEPEDEEDSGDKKGKKNKKKKTTPEPEEVEPEPCEEEEPEPTKKPKKTTTPEPEPAPAPAPRPRPQPQPAPKPKPSPKEEPLPPPPQKSPKKLVLGGVDEGCEYKAKLNGALFELQGRTRSGAPYYKAAESDEYLYHITTCDDETGERTPSVWVLDSEEPAKWKKGKKKRARTRCDYNIAHLEEAILAGPPAIATWKMWCDERKVLELTITLWEVPEPTDMSRHNATMLIVSGAHRLRASLLAALAAPLAVLLAR